MLKGAKHGLLWLFAVGVFAITTGCQGGPSEEVTLRGATNERPSEETPSDSYKATPTVKDFLSACDTLARSLAISTAIQTGGVKVVEIAPIDNKSDVPLDLTIYPQTIRGILNKLGAPNVAFRDELSRNQIVAERIEQTADKLTVTDDSTTDSGTRWRLDGTVDGMGVPLPEGRVKAKRVTKRATAVGKGLTDVNYFLNGFIYAENEVTVGNSERGYRYFQVQFRLTDAKTGVIVWEDFVRVKRAGYLK